MFITFILTGSLATYNACSFVMFFSLIFLLNSIILMWVCTVLTGFYEHRVRMYITNYYAFILNNLYL